MVTDEPRQVNANNRQGMNTWIRQELAKVSQQKGLPLNPAVSSFDFYGYAEAVLRKRGYEGLNLDEKTNSTIQRLIFDDRNGGPGPLLRQFDGRADIISYYKNAVNNRAISELRDDRTKQRNIPTVNIKPSGKDETTPGVSQDTIPGGETELNDEGMDSTVSGIAQYLAMQRHGDILGVIFRLLAPEPQGQGLNQQEVVQYLNDNAVASPTGETRWSPGMVNSYIQKMRKAVNQYIEEENKGEGGEGTLHMLRRERAKPPAPEVTQPKSRYMMWAEDGDQSKEQPVEIVRQSQNNTRVRLKDGTLTVVPTKHLFTPR